MLRGAADKVREAGANLIGGHSIDDPEPKLGLSVTGKIHPDRIWRKKGAQPGDRLILTKPIGVGIHTTAIKRNMLKDSEIQRVTQCMALLNRDAARIMHRFTIHACTDVTGFGLLGHAYEMSRASGVGLIIDAADVPILPRTEELASQGVVPGGTHANAEWLQDNITLDNRVDPTMHTILCDAVTSGGLLASVPEQQAPSLLQALHAGGINEARVIGRVTANHPGNIHVR